MFKFEYDAHTDRWGIESDPGSNVQTHEVARVLSVIVGDIHRQPNRRVPSPPEIAAMRALPSGWEATLDGFDTNSLDGVMSYRRTYKRSDGATTTAPCAPDGSNVPDTKVVLTAYDADHPIAPPMAEA